MAKVIETLTCAGYSVLIYPECPFAEGLVAGVEPGHMFCTLYPDKTMYRSCAANQMGHEVNPDDPEPRSCPYGK